MSEQKKSRRSLVLQSTVAGGVATAVLLGGFGAFSLWNDSLGAGAGNIATGYLEFEDITDGGWKIIQTDGVLAPNTAINPATFKASPGDVLQYTANVNVRAKADDMLAEVTIDPHSYTIDPSLTDYVTVELSSPSAGDTGAIPVDTTGGAQSIPVQVTVTFDDGMWGRVGQDRPVAVALGGLSFKLDQVAG